MTKTSEPILFFGSGPVAAESLRLLNENFTIEGVVTKPRAAHHKGDVPVLTLAEKLDLPIQTASTMAELDALFAQKPFTSRLAILIDFGIIVSQDVIDYFPLGIINSHFSLLPEWRGADPITFSILSGQESTGVSLMLVTAGLDEGPILSISEYALSPTITTPELTDNLVKLSDALLTSAIPRYISGDIKPAPQTITGRKESYSRKLNKDDGRLDWQKPAAVLEREIRAFTEWPKSRTNFGTLDVILTRAHVIDASGKPGTTAIIDKLPIVYCGAQALAIDLLKPAGKKEMTGEGFLAGYKQLFL
ncbi:MAG TPA: methionyl-tRNA formyltransferase [Candidatus Saccharimonadales bacterium]|jgi:methionyl-tRNA formyltransferase|nr:methionyl-tRNA formyltransferase [Candidatus Saccharimonadales bacterium]